MALSDLAIVLKEHGYTENSNLYQLVLCMIDMGSANESVRQLEYSAKLGAELCKVSDIDSIRNSLTYNFEFYHLQWNKSDNTVSVIDDFDIVVYHFDNSSLEGLPYPPKSCDLYVYHQALVKLNIIRSLDIVIQSG